MRALIRFVVVAILLSHSDALACITVSEANRVVPVAQEEAVIVWEPAQKLEHFVRRARFESSKPFGFLVPTPTRPELAEADDGVFKRLAGAVARASQLRGAQSPKSLEGLSAVEVLEEKTVAGMHATVLKAGDTAALRQWLEGQHFSTRPAFDAWAKPYVAKGWIFTAFRYEPARGSSTLLSKAVRMTFHTDAPFFPYREPEDVPSKKPRLLRIYLVAPERMTSSVARTFAAKVDRLEYDLAGAVDAVSAENGLWLHVFNDPSPSRAGASDLFFKPSDR